MNAAMGNGRDDLAKTPHLLNRGNGRRAQGRGKKRKESSKKMETSAQAVNGNGQSREFAKWQLQLRVVVTKYRSIWFKIITLNSKKILQNGFSII